MAAHSISHAHSGGASLRQAADHSHAIVVSGHDQVDAGGGRSAKQGALCTALPNRSRSPKQR